MSLEFFATFQFRKFSKIFFENKKFKSWPMSNQVEAMATRLWKIWELEDISIIEDVLVLEVLLKTAYPHSKLTQIPVLPF